MSQFKRPLTALERHFVKTLELCEHETCDAGACECDDCAGWMDQYGRLFGRYPGACKECMGTGFALKRRPIPLDENGVPVRQPPKPEGAEKIIGGTSAQRSERRHPETRKPIRRSGSLGSGQTIQQWKEEHGKGNK